MESDCIANMECIKSILTNVVDTDDDIKFLGSITTKVRRTGKEADESLRPAKKLKVNSNGCNGRNTLWPNLPNRVQDAIAIKLEPSNEPEAISSRMIIIEQL
ncbi:210_t:CDS:2 [Racocetra persica]|uniref:210_t:CDS:1 n=1 Tax=Racocetra persica TaxID=160502 RepID=A0ACA9LM40_9GLOM|nr:210_t:CDS:2 [Racocetra persica]